MQIPLIKKTSISHHNALWIFIILKTQKIMQQLFGFMEVTLPVIRPQYGLRLTLITGALYINPFFLAFKTAVLMPAIINTTSLIRNSFSNFMYKFGIHVAAIAIDTGNIVAGRSHHTPCKLWFHPSDLILNRSTIGPL